MVKILAYSAMCPKGSRSSSTSLALMDVTEGRASKDTLGAMPGMQPNRTVLLSTHHALNVIPSAHSRSPHKTAYKVFMALDLGSSTCQAPWRL